VRILNRLPYFADPTQVSVPSETVRVKPYQIIAWASVTPPDLPGWNARIPLLPVILDTGNTHNFSIRAGQLRSWAGVHPESLELLGTVRDKALRLPLRAADIWLHFNRPGERDPRRDREPWRLNLEEGIALYPEEANWPRLPLLGLRALTDNELRLTIDGKRRYVTVSIGGHWWWPFSI
jgi:hypothetical protein